MLKPTPSNIIKAIIYPIMFGAVNSDIDAILITKIKQPTAHRTLMKPNKINNMPLDDVVGVTGVSGAT